MHSMDPATAAPSGSASRRRIPIRSYLCYCSICRKTAGAGGFAINLGADARTLKVEGRGAYPHLPRAHARRGRGRHRARRAQVLRALRLPLWVWDPRWPDLVHPHASAIDTPLPVPPERTHSCSAARPPGSSPASAPKDQTFDRYPEGVACRVAPAPRPRELTLCGRPPPAVSAVDIRREVSDKAGKARGGATAWID